MKQWKGVKALAKNRDRQRSILVEINNDLRVPLYIEYIELYRNYGPFIFFCFHIITYCKMQSKIYESTSKQNKALTGIIIF